MKEVFYNYDFLDKEDINNTIKRAKLLIINSNDEILLGYGHGDYQLIGGHVENGESFDECLVREVKEETGILLPLEKRKPFLVIRHYIKNYPEVNVNSEYIHNYYMVNTNQRPNLDSISLTDYEKDGNFEFKYVKVDKIMKVLEDNLRVSTKKGVVLDTIEAVKEYLYQKNGEY